MHDRISIDPNICHGKACIRGTRVLDNLSAGLSADEIVRSNPTLQPQNVPDALVYAADSINERTLQ